MAKVKCKYCNKLYPSKMETDYTGECSDCEDKPLIVKLKTKCKGWDKGIIKSNIVPCGKTITIKNSSEESRAMEMCDKCFKKELDFIAKIQGQERDEKGVLW